MSASPRETATAFWAALYDRDWARIRSFFGPESIYYDVPTGPSAAACSSGRRSSWLPLSFA